MAFSKAVSKLAGVLHRTALPSGILLVGLTLNAALYVRMERARARFDESRRDNLITSVEATLRARLAVFEDVLSAAAADLTSSAHLTDRKDWGIFVDRLGLFRRYPGAEAFSILQPVSGPNLQEFLDAERRQAPGDFKISSPFGPPLSSEHIVVVAAEPPAVSARSLGSDLAGDVLRQRAADRARDTGSAALVVNKVFGYQPQKNLQLFLPVYRRGLPAATVEQRRAALAWFVTVVFSADAFVRSAMTGREPFLDLQVFYGSATPANLVFSSNHAPPPGRSFERLTAIDLAGAPLTLGWNRGPQFPSVSRRPSLWTVASGATLTLLIAGVIGMLQFSARRIESKLVLEQSRSEETQAFLASLVQSSEDSIVGTTLDGIIKSWNRGSEQLWGFTAAEAIGQHISMLFTPERRGEYLHQIVRIENGEPIEPFESVRVTKDGRRIDVAVIISPIRDSRGRLLGLSAVYSDITRRKRAEEELVRAKEAAEAANRAKSQFLANMSHEIRTPMNGILGMTEAALDTPLDAEQRDYLVTARSSAEALLTVINDILDFSKIEAGMLHLESAAFCVRDTVAESVKLLALPARQKGLDLSFRVHDSVPETARGDALRIRQVLVNLIGNAVKFTSHGRVSVVVESESATDSVCTLRFSVRDTGIGISRETQQMIFAPFTQADGSTTRKYGGTGLGLTISRRLVEMMGGQIWVESEPQRGSAFSFTIPVAVFASHPETVPAA